jgi:hypothetical protein
MYPRSIGAFVVSLGLINVSFGQFEHGPQLPRKALLGAQLTPLTAEKAKLQKLTEGAVEVTRIIPGTTAEAMKLLVGDIIVSLNGKKTPTVPEFMGSMRNIYGNQSVSVKVLRAGKSLDLNGISVEKPKQKGDGFTVEYTQVMSLGKRIRVVATHPIGTGPFPTIFMIGGIGSYSLDGEYNAVPYGNILSQFAKTYTIIRTEKPGQGDSDGPIYTDLLFDAELDAYIQSLRMVKALPYVDKNRIAIFGHSMGGVFGPLVAQVEPVAGIAASATISKTWMEYMLENTRRQALLSGGAAQDVDQSLISTEAACHALFVEGLSPREAIRKHPELKSAVNGMVPDGKTYSGVGIQFFQQLAKKNLPAAWAKSNAKAIALWGENDFISTRYDHELIAEMMNKLHPGSAEFMLVPQSDHGFLKTNSMQESKQKWGRGGAPFNPNIIEILRTWFKKTIG